MIRDHLKPVTDEQVFCDKLLCGKFYLLVCIRNFDNFTVTSTLVPAKASL